jgi:hypothetical protein
MAVSSSAMVGFDTVDDYAVDTAQVVFGIE